MACWYADPVASSRLWSLMLLAMSLYTRNGAFTVTNWPLSYSCVDRRTEPAGPVP